MWIFYKDKAINLALVMLVEYVKVEDVVRFHLPRSYTDVPGVYRNEIQGFIARGAEKALRLPDEV